MSGTASVTNTFNSAVTATGLQLDTNYNNLTAYLNDPTNRNNFATDTGNTNTVVLTFSPVVAGYTTGLEISFKATNTNSGATVVNANALGNKNLVNPDGSALGSSQIKAGSIYAASYDGTQFVGIGFNSTPSATAKSWGVWSGTATGTVTALASFNVSSIVRNGTGTYSITFTTPFSSASYVCVAASSGVCAYSVFNKGTSTFQISVANAVSGSATDPAEVEFVSYGTQ